MKTISINIKNNKGEERVVIVKPVALKAIDRWLNGRKTGFIF